MATVIDTENDRIDEIDDDETMDYFANIEDMDEDYSDDDDLYEDCEDEEDDEFEDDEFDEYDYMMEH